MGAIDLEYRPRKHQEELHLGVKRFAVVVAHRRFGKTVFCLAHMIDRALRCDKPNPRYAYIAPLYRQAKAVAWDYAKEMTRKIPGTTVNEAELRIDLPNGAQIRLYGADNPDSLRGIYLDGVILDEYAQMSPVAWSQVIRPALSDRLGWAIFIGTPKGRNAFCELYEEAATGRAGADWSAHMYRVSETNVVDPGELAKARADMSEDEFEQEYECSFMAAIKGAYYGQEMTRAEREGRITRVPWEPTLPVTTAWDLGIRDSTAIWFVQQAGREVRVIDYYEHASVGLEHYAKRLREPDYVYGHHIGPHDAKVKELGTGLSRLDTLAQLGIRMDALEQANREDGINAARRLLARCWFDADKCKKGIEALRQYRREWDDKAQALRDTPKHDWTSHGADAFRYLAMGLRPVEAGPRQIVAESEYANRASLFEGAQPVYAESEY